ncbi:hydrophobin-domain-containing protein [Heliocybe sulcata]|uniref:Hydrophobin n=1 Tax=Heliocybe sulcata TaxID=5364 RepID=A0A5C3N3C0_9AGAM|nr:hydrophobin-domain-containing protein [Heliocybe sulcata]
MLSSDADAAPTPSDDDTSASATPTTPTDDGSSATPTASPTTTSSSSDDTATSTSSSPTPSPTDSDTSSPNGQCNSGTPQCCQSVTTASDPAASGLLDMLDLTVDPNSLVGLRCTVGLDNCQAQPVCCENTQQNGLINIGCTNIAL